MHTSFAGLRSRPFSILTAHPYLALAAGAALFATVAFLAPSPAFAATNLVANPSLEAGATTTAVGWSANNWGNNTSVLSITSDAHTGTRAGKVVTSSRVDGDAKWVFDAVTVSSGQYISFKGWFKSSTTTEVDAFLYKSDGSIEYLRMAELKSASDWTEYHTEFIVPAGVVKVQLVHILASTGSLTIDDQSLEAGAPPVFQKGMVSLTFDDGWKSMFENAIPVLNAAGLKSTQYLITDTMMNPDNYQLGTYLTPADAAAMKAAGHDIEAHTRLHLDLTLPSTDLNSEINGSKTDLESLGYAIDSLAYPYGRYNGAVEVAAANAGFLGARSVDSGYNFTNSDKYALKIQNVTDVVSLTDVKGWIDTAVSQKVWLVLMMHKVGSTTAACTPGEEECISKDMLKQISDYLVAQHVPVKTMHEGLGIMGGAPITYTINASAGAHGSITPAGSTAVAHSATQAYTITPASGYGIGTLLVDGAAVPNAMTYTFTNVTDDHTISASFVQTTHTITATAGANGTISPMGTTTVIDGTDSVFTMTPASGYRVDVLFVDGAQVTLAQSYTFSANTANHTISVSFTKVDVGGSNGGSSGGSSGGGGGGGSTPTTPTTPATTTPPKPATTTPPTGGGVLGASTYNFTKDLFIGMSGKDVTELQKVLVTEKFLKVAPTGYFGVATYNAVKAYQKAHGITPVSGYVGAKTRAILNKGAVAVLPVQTTVATLESQLAALLAQLAALQALAGMNASVRL